MFKFLKKWFTKEKTYHEVPRMYVIIRGDLHPTYAMVQGAHALTAFIMKHPNQTKEWNNEYLIFLKVFNYKELISFKEDILTKSENVLVRWSVFNEPDLDNQMTAIALYDNGRVVDGLHLA